MLDFIRREVEDFKKLFKICKFTKLDFIKILVFIIAFYSFLVVFYGAINMYR